MFLYIVIPTINGEIFGSPIVVKTLEYDFSECTIYELICDTLYIKELYL